MSVSSILWSFAWISSMVPNLSASVSFLEIGRSHRVPNQESTVGGGWHPSLFCQKLLGEDGSVRQGVMVKQPGLFSPKFGATSSHVFTQSPQNVAVETEFTVWPVGTGASCYHNCYIDGGTNPEYFGYHLVIGAPTKFEIRHSQIWLGPLLTP
jgi:hypothetical protein